MIGKPPQQVQGSQHGDHNVQQNFFAPVTTNLFIGSYERLIDVCFDPAGLERDLDLDRFTGREWLIEQIDAFIRSHERGYVVVRGEAGVGKSSLAAHLVATRLWLHHFTRLPGGRSAEAARKSLGAQLVARWQLEDKAPGGMLPAAASRPDWFDMVVRSAALRRDAVEPGTRIVLVVDGLDEVEPNLDGGLPLGLPSSLPDGVFVVATSRFGVERELHAIRNPASWTEIEVEGAANLADMRKYIDDVTDPRLGDQRLMTALTASSIQIGRFRNVLAARCNGVWIYLRYVLDEIRDRIRDPAEIGRLPDDLAGYYAGQISRWRGDHNDPAVQTQWTQVRLPLLGTLGAARAPLNVSELASFAGVAEDAVVEFAEETARAFLARQPDPVGQVRYSFRHQSLRDLLTGNGPGNRPDVTSQVDTLVTQVQRAHHRIVDTLIPPSQSTKRSWRCASPYAREHLAAHAAAVGLLDDLVIDPGFLTIIAPGSLLTQRTKIQAPSSRRAVEAFEMCLHSWDPCTNEERLEALALNAARLQAGTLHAACTANSRAPWRVCWAAWPRLSHRVLSSHVGEVTAVAIGRAGDHDIVVSGSGDGTVQTWDAVTGQPFLMPLRGDGGNVSAVAIGCAGDRDVIVSGSNEKILQIWDAVTGDPVCPPLRGHYGRVNAVAIGRADNRDIIVSGSNDSTVRIWDALTGEPVKSRIYGHYSRVNAVAIGRAGNRDIIVSASKDKTLRIWDAVTGEPASPPLHGHDSPVTSVAIGCAGSRDVIVSGSDDATVRIWDPPIGDRAILARQGHDSSVTAVAIGRAGDRDVIVSGSRDATVRVWDASTGDPASLPLQGHDGRVMAVAIGRAGDRDVIITGCRDQTVRVWDAVTGELTGPQIGGHNMGVNAVAIGRAGDRDIIVSACDDLVSSPALATVRIWDAVTGMPASPPLRGHAKWVNAVAIGRAGDRDVIVLGSDEATIQLWDAVTGEPVSKVLGGHDGRVTAIAIGRAGNRDIVVSGSNDKSLRIWDAVTGEPACRPLHGHDSGVTSVAIGRAGNRDIIISGSHDATVRLWDAVTGEPASRPLRGHDSGVTAVAIGRAGNRDIIVSGSYDQSIVLWARNTAVPGS